MAVPVVDAAKESIILDSYSICTVKGSDGSKGTIALDRAHNLSCSDDQV
jgi:hypothetical protein